MQLRNCTDAALVAALSKSLHASRINRYKKAADDAGVSPLEYYAWNCELSEAFYVSLHFAEIVCRNAIHDALVFRSGTAWVSDSTFRKIIDHRFLDQLDTAIRDETKQHGAFVSEHHVVSALTFGFWEHLTTKRFQRYLWPNGVRQFFPNAPQSVGLKDIHDTIESVRRWRNRIAHHQAIFDKGPTRKHQDALSLIGWRCHDTAKWVSAASRVPQVIAARP
jgi:hypothetical protein